MYHVLPGLQKCTTIWPSSRTKIWISRSCATSTYSSSCKFSIHETKTSLPPVICPERIILTISWCTDEKRTVNPWSGQLAIGAHVWSWSRCSNSAGLFKSCFRLVIFRSEYDDWRPHLGSLLQPIPFPDEYVFLAVFPQLRWAFDFQAERL